MILGNKCDINDKRQVSKDRGEKVRFVLQDTVYFPDTKAAKGILLFGKPFFRLGLPSKVCMYILTESSEKGGIRRFFKLETVSS